MTFWHRKIIIFMDIFKSDSNSLPFPRDSILEATLTVSPNKQYLGILFPTTPATTVPKTGKGRQYLYICSCRITGKQSNRIRAPFLNKCLPEWQPIRRVNFMPGRCGISKCRNLLTRSNAIFAISEACCFPLCLGTPVVVFYM